MTTHRPGPRGSRARPSRPRRAVLPLLAAGLVAGALPVAGPASAAEGAEPAFSGYSGEAWAAPVRLEIYEPTLPIPASPQLELLLGYSRIEADSGSGAARASYLWPGDPVGEGLKTFLEQLGFPQQLVDPIAGNGYPVQVNSAFPGGPETAAQEPLPGAVMRTSAAEGQVVARAGFSTDCDVEAPTAAAPGLPGLPGLPRLPEVPGLSGLTALLGGGAAGSGPAAASPAAPSAAPPAAPSAAPACQIPSALSALVDVGGFASTSRSVRTDGQVVTSARASLGDVALFGGIVTLSGFGSTASATSDGRKATAQAGARLGEVTIAGQTFGFGADGFEAAGRQLPIPALPDDPAKALKALGISLSVPKPTRTAAGEAAEASASALVVEVDTQVLSPLLSKIPLAELLGGVPFPPEAAILKSLLTALPNLAPRLVLTLGTATSAVETVQGIELPELPAGPPAGAPGTDAADPGTDEAADPGAGGGTGTGTGTGAGAAPGAGAVPGADPGAGAGATGTDDAAAAGDLPPTTRAAAGLPPLFSIPGMLLIAGIGLALVAGTWLRKIGALALGGGAACAHGLDSGLPDLRKA